MSEDEFDFESVIDTLEAEDHFTEEVYELENLKHVYGGDAYNEVMTHIHSEDYDAARETLQEYQTNGGTQ